MLITYPMFFWLILGGWGELRLGHFPEIFKFFTNFWNLIMHIGGPLSFRLVYFLTFIHSSDFSEILPECRDNCYEHKSITADPAKTLVLSQGTFIAKNAPFWGFSDICPKFHYVSSYSGFFGGVGSKFASLNAWYFIVYLFCDRSSVPMGSKVVGKQKFNLVIFSKNCQKFTF